MDRVEVSQLEIVETGRSRRWSDALRLQIVGQSFAAPVTPPVPPPGLPPLLRRARAMEIVLANGRRIIAGADVDAGALSRVVAALEGQ